MNHVREVVAANDPRSALVFTGENAFEIWGFMGRLDLVLNLDTHPTDHPVIETPMGSIQMKPGDSIHRTTTGFAVTTGTNRPLD